MVLSTWKLRVRTPTFSRAQNLPTPSTNSVPSIRGGLWDCGQFTSQHGPPRMNTEIENVVVDEANQRTYIVRARRALTDGEIYRLIRREILKRGGKPLASGETLTLTLATGAGN